MVFIRDLVTKVKSRQYSCLLFGGNLLRKKCMRYISNTFNARHIHFKISNALQFILSVLLPSEKTLEKSLLFSLSIFFHISKLVTVSSYIVCNLTCGRENGTKMLFVGKMTIILPFDIQFRKFYSFTVSVNNSSFYKKKLF